MDTKKPTTDQTRTPTSDPHLFYMFAYIFLQTLVGNAILRIYVWPHFPDNGLSHFALVFGTRAILDAIGRAQYNRGTGTKVTDRDPWWVNGLVLILPTILVDLGLGGCWFRCEVRGLARGYCAASLGKSSAVKWKFW